ncbi:DNA polymerase Y family protein [Lacrimispora sphenoides]|uniref:DNA polymerase IV n=1 Tax=Lacrimispora sphenoides JCM 1415 TaxID=1297793 RepID=A0ABY1C3F2_9FIRM|nr:DNA polymerase IV [Lacrimispora sphenoides]SET60378.1 DNA polymerase-4 [[Clostridium] sphenoides JCM 1415]SUY50004.1 DNA-directed DNA polymerase [Lacrimispora sphenoides]
MAQEPLIFHIDVNSAFLSWESVSRLEADFNALDLRTIPSAVGGDASLRHGIVLAKSTPAKAYGIITGEPISQALRKCPALTVVPARFDIYLDKSRKLMELLSDYTPDIEKFSIDEAFLDMTSTIHLFGPPLEVANQIRERIWQELKFTVNVGVAPNKLLAKMASDFKKPNLCHTLFAHEIPSKMWPLPIRELFFVGHSAQKKLEGIGIHTIGELAACSVGHLKPLLGEKYALLIHDYALGIDTSPVEEREPLNKGYGNSTTLSHDIDDLDVACQVLLSLCETVGARLRSDHVLSDCVCVEIKDWNFHTKSHQMTLNNPTDSTTVIYENACNLLKELWDRTPLRLIGVRATKISEEGFCQLNLFESEQARKMKEMEKAVDHIRGKFGTDSVKRASFLKKDSIVDHTSGRGKSGIK